MEPPLDLPGSSYARSSQNSKEGETLASTRTTRRFITWCLVGTYCTLSCSCIDCGLRLLHTMRLGLATLPAAKRKKEKEEKTQAPPTMCHAGPSTGQASTTDIDYCTPCARGWRARLDLRQPRQPRRCPRLGPPTAPPPTDRMGPHARIRQRRHASSSVTIHGPRAVGVGAAVRARAGYVGGHPDSLSPWQASGSAH